MAPPVAPAVRAEPPLTAGPDPRRLRALPPEPDTFSEASAIPPVTGPGFAAYGPEPEPDDVAVPAELAADLRPSEPAAPRVRAGLPPLRKTARRAVLVGGALVAVLVVVWIFSGSSPTPAPEDTAASAPATETPAEPEVPGIKVGTVWMRIPVAVVDGSGGKMTASGPFRLRVDGQVYTIATEAMPIIPVEPGSRVEARAVSGTVTLTVTP
ncbi:hypothetical protein ACRC7T_17685, partial [Segnochrobactraceae bacterium EtOH-i3]